MKSFDLPPQPRIVFGNGSIDQLGQFATSDGACRALVVSDPGVVAAGHTARGMEALKNAGIEPHLFDEVRENPTIDDVERGVVAAQCLEPHMIIGIGGGSSMDCAKGINFVFSCGGTMEDYWGIGKATGPLLPMIAVPTTSGTGSEAQSFALISHPETGQKMACGDRRAAFRLALLDPELTRTQPPQVTALTGIDAITHALETFVTTKRTAFSKAYSREAWRMLSRNFSHVLKQPDEIESRGAMQLGACFAGLAIENSMLGAAHALANPLTARFGVTHGQAVGVMMPHVVRFNADVAEDAYDELFSMVDDSLVPQATGSAGLEALISHWLQQAQLETRLQSLGVEKSSLPDLADLAAQQWTAGFNPRKVEREQLHQIYLAAF
ncbi:MAG: iron-containing alcohol dehydrogenase [Planctomycetota bacterium]|nr:iron-containing alcohol dehydrogenase [Planctomycetota bacterium]MEC8336655.1 iron-containing alcohol dehydrogenase [Planctomycetota bacterium]